MNMDILAFEKYEYGHFGLRKINSIYDVFKLKQNFRKNWVVTGKTPFFVIGPFCTPYSICVNIGFLQSSFAVLYGNAMLSILVLSTKNRYSSFLKRVCDFQKIYFKVKVLKSFEIFSDCHIKPCRSLKWKAILKIPSIIL